MTVEDDWGALGVLTNSCFQMSAPWPPRPVEEKWQIVKGKTLTTVKSDYLVRNQCDNPTAISHA
ncbi:hypothetical protein X777_01352 [Ooceraea biroi]|uniref:Uncharacterized protein n=1 Tax=Ooceraea biroi TaxID=2015173 RepID=A0A026WQT8_OOCBI|nr:hypothetical protein X777_01352 [Ooceraea biroi]